MQILFTDLTETTRLHHATRAKAERLARAFEADYPILSLHCELNEDASQVTGWVTRWNASDRIPEEGFTDITITDKVPELADVLEASDEAGLDPEATFEEDEDKVSGSVVPETYRLRYREASSNGQTCGDWLAEFLVGQTHGSEGFHVDEFTALLSSNDVDLSTAWGRLPMSGQKGWIGRYRMNGRQALEKIVALRGYVVTAMGEKVTVPEADLAVLRSKHEKWIAKQEKLAAEAGKAEAEAA